MLVLKLNNTNFSSYTTYKASTYAMRDKYIQHVHRYRSTQIQGNHLKLQDIAWVEYNK